MLALIVSARGEHGFHVVAVDDDAAADAFLASHPGVEAIRKPLLTADGYDELAGSRVDLSDEAL